MRKKNPVRRAKTRKVIIGLMLMLLAAIGARLALPWALLGLANRHLPVLLGTGTHLEDLELNLRRGRVTLHNFSVAQPEKFGPAPLLSINRLEAAVDREQLAGGHIRLHVRLDGLSANIARHADGTWNIDALIPEDNRPVQPAARPERTGRRRLAFSIARAEINAHALAYRDTFNRTDLTVTNLALRAADITVISRDGATPLKGTCSIGGRLVRSDTPAADFELQLELGPLDLEATELSAMLNLTGAAPALAEPWLTPEAAEALGPALDLDARLSISNEMWRLRMLLSDDGGRPLAEIGEISFDPAGGICRAENLFLAQPRGFGTHPLLVVPRLESGFTNSAALTTFTHIEITEPELHLRRDIHGRWPWYMFDTPAAADGQTATSEDVPGPALVFADIAIRGMTCSYHDHSSDTPVNIRLENLDFKALNLSLTAGHANAAGDARVELRADVRQGDLTPARLNAALTGTYAADRLAGLEADLRVEDVDPRALLPQRSERIRRGLGEAPANLRLTARMIDQQLTGQLLATGKEREPLGGIQKFTYDQRENTFEANGIHIAQPHGHPAGDLLNIARITVRAAPDGMNFQRLHLDRAEIIDPRLHLRRDTAGMMNYELLLPDPPPAGETPPASDAGVDHDTADPAGAPPGAVCLLDSLILKNGALSFTDQRRAGPPLTIRAGHINAQGEGLVFATEKQYGAAPGKIMLTGQLQQTARTAGIFGLFAREFDSPGLFGLTGIIGPLGDGIPELNAACCLIGLELHPFTALLPPGTKRLIGGDAMDLSSRIKLSPELLNARFTATTIAGNSLPLVILRGTPQQPRVQVSSLALGVAERIGGTMGNIALDLGRATRQVGDTAMRATLDISRGALRTVQSTGSGIINTIRGAAETDLNAITSGLRQATLDTAQSTFVSVYDLGEGVVQGAAATKRSGTGRARTAAWRADIPQRWERQWRRAREDVERMPYPPADN